MCAIHSLATCILVGLVSGLVAGLVRRKVSSFLFYLVLATGGVKVWCGAMGISG